MNGSNGIVPTVDLATNGAYYGGGFGNAFGGDGIWALVLLALLFGNNGWGGGFGGNGFNNIATTDYISSEFTQRDVNNGTQSVLTALSNGFSDAATNTCNLRSDVLTGNMGLQNSILDSKYAAALGNANTQRDVLMQTTQLENQLSNVALSNQAHVDSCCCEIKSLIREDGDKTRALITENTIQDLRDRLTAAKDVISDQRTESNIVNALRPYPVPAYLTGSPYVGFNNGFYGGGFYGNTIV